MTENFVQYILALQRSLEAKYNFFGKFFVTVFFVEISNFIGYANTTTCDIKLHEKASFI